MQDEATQKLLGRERLLGTLADLVDQVVAGERVTALVAGEAGIGKSSLLRAMAGHATARGARTVWGTCLDIDGAPGFWPWTQVVEALLGTTDVPPMGTEPTDEGSERDRVLAMDATRRLLEGHARDRPLLVVLDDLQWADASSLALLELVARFAGQVGLGLIGAYRSNEVPLSTRRRLSSLASTTEHLRVEGLDVDAVRGLLERVTGEAVERELAAAVHRRTGGHPFFVRELALLGSLADAGGERVPSVVRDAIERRIDGLPEATIAVLETAAIVGRTLHPDVIAAVLDSSAVEVDAATRAGIEAGMLTTSTTGELGFAHDLLRETLEDRVDGPRRVELHRAVGAALEDRIGRGGQAPPSELARHFIAALPLDGPDRAVRWAIAAAAADRASFAFDEAAGQLRRLRDGLAAFAVEVDDVTMVDLLIAEADALARAGATVEARDLLRHASELGERSGSPRSIARVALATAHLGAQFATRRDEVIRQLDHALEVATGSDDAVEARLTATLARELAHSVAEDRPRAGALSERALDLGRRSGDAATLLDCLVARHDVLWQPGGGEARAEIAHEIVATALAAGAEDRHAEGLLLLANALLEQGSPAFEGALESCLAILEVRRQPRHRYLALTRRACVALLRGHLAEAERLVEEARAMGERILEPDVGNVYMSQRLELVRARAQPEELVAFASAAVGHWTGAPIHAHAVAAGFLARAGDLDAANHHLAAVIDLGSWRADRSYLWSVFTRELAHAAVALDRRELCRELLDDLRPLAGSCGVNGAVVAFAGSHAQTAGMLAAAVDEPEVAGLLLDQAAATYRRLGAAGWLAETQPARPSAAPPGATASMRRDGAVWHLRFGGQEATVPHTKGLADIARLLARPGAEIHVLELVDAPVRSASSGDLADRSALAAYRQRLADLDADVDDAERDNDSERRARATVEREALIDELARVTGPVGQPRQFANHPAERARKAVTGRIRDTIRKLEAVLPELAAHLERTLVTGTYCRYRPDVVEWQIAD